jgi:ferric-dicitrate binding protein FerR (iron transport regulator)
MNRRERFEIWKRRRERIEVSIGFPERVMAHLKERPAPRRASAPVSRLRRVVARPWAKAAIIVLGVLLGLVRIVLTLDLILRA